MSDFLYKALNEAGVVVSGQLEADSQELAAMQLMDRGLVPTELKERRAGLVQSVDDALARLTGRVKAQDLILFTKQLSTMLRAGVPIMRLIQVLEIQTENKTLKKVIATIHEDVRTGSTLYDAFAKHKNIFSPLYCSMVNAGETAGALPAVLDRLTFIIEHEHKVKSDIKSAMTYPVIVVLALVSAFFILLTKVVPVFVNIFNRSGIEIPVPTRICMSMYTTWNEYWIFILLFLLAFIVGFVTYFRTEQGRLVRDIVLLRVPYLGDLFVKAAMSRFASIFSILQGSGVNILDIMNILERTIGNAAISRDFKIVQEELREGRGIAEPLQKTYYFTPMVINMVAIGEESGNLEDMLNSVSVHYDAEVMYATKKLTDALGPILVLSLAGVVGFFALAIYMPMWDLVKMVRK